MPCGPPPSPPSHSLPPAQGWEVYAGVRRAVDGEALQEAAGGSGAMLHPLTLDVTDTGSVAAAAERVGVMCWMGWRGGSDAPSRRAPRHARR